MFWSDRINSLQNQLAHLWTSSCQKWNPFLAIIPIVEVEYQKREIKSPHGLFEQGLLHF